MISYLVTPEHRYTIDVYLGEWGRALRSRMRVLPYTRLAYQRRFARGTYLFSDLERLSAVELAAAAALADALLAAGALVLNHPARVLRRYPLLRALHDAGINRFNAHSLERRDEVRLPAFLRVHDEHAGSLTPVLRTPSELESAVATLPPDLDRSRVIVVEYCHTADAAGTFRKYSAFKIGTRLFPRHLLFSRDWVDRVPDLVTEALAAEEREFLCNHPHAAILARVFELACIDYGRIDYGVLDGEVQVWEINTNPMITPRPGTIAPLRLSGQIRAAEQLAEAFAAIDCGADGAPVRFDVGAAATRELARCAARRQLSTALRWINRGRKGRVWRALTGWNAKQSWEAGEALAASKERL
jgi:hypothetical protein